MNSANANPGSSGDTPADDGQDDAVLADDALVGDYLTRSRKAAWYLPRDRRELVLGQIADRIADAMEPPQQLSSAGDIAGLLAKLGKPKDSVRAIDGFIPGTEAGWLEYTAIILVLIGGLFFNLGWVIGLVLLWTSARWRWPDKLLATLVWPGGLLVARLLMERYNLESFSGAGSSVGFVLHATLGHHPLRHFLVLAVAIAPPALVAIWLLRRARRPRLHTAP